MSASNRLPVWWLAALTCGAVLPAGLWLAGGPLSGGLGWCLPAAAAATLAGLALEGRRAWRQAGALQACLQQELRLCRERVRDLQAVADAVPAQIAHIDRHERAVFVNARVARVYGWDPQALIGRSMREVFGDTEYGRLQPMVRQALAGQAVSFEHCAQRHGQDRYAQVEYIPDIDASGQVGGFFVMVSDVTQRKRAELLHQQSEERLRTITGNLPMLISYLDHELRVRFCNDTFKQWFGTPASAVLGLPVAQALGPQLMAQVGDALARAARGERVELEHTARSRRGLLHLHATYVPHLADDGSVIGVYTLSTDVTALKESQQRLNRLAMLDALTGLPNRRSFHERLRESMVRAVETRAPMALMFLDVDHFKSINDLRGHAVGDAVLQGFAARVHAGVRRSDMVARLGGDEFVVVLDGLADASEADRIADKIVKAVRAQPIEVPGGPVAVTTSLGLAVFVGQDASEAALMARADAALYAAKKAGRDGWCLAAPAA